MDHLQSKAWAEAGHRLSLAWHNLADLQSQGNQFPVVSTADITNQHPSLRVLIQTDSHSQSTQIGPWLPLLRDLSPTWAVILRKSVTLRQALFLLFSSCLNGLFKSVPLLCHLPSPTKAPGGC